MNTDIKIPSPWTPVQTEESDSGITVSVWGRRYDFGHSPFPEHIYVQDGDILTSPIRLCGIEGGNPIVWETPESYVMDENDAAVTIVTAMQSRFAVVNVIHEIAYDGYIRSDIRVSIRGNHIRGGYDHEIDREKHIISQLHLEIPLRRDVARLHHNSDTGKPLNGDFSEGGIPFKPFNWYGNDKCGLGIYFDSDEYWQSIDENRAIETELDGDTATIRFRLFDSRPKVWEYEDKLRHGTGYEMSQAIDLTPIFFGISMQATPVKPYDVSQYRERHVHIDCFSKIEREYSSYLLDKVSDTDDTVVFDRLKNAGVTVLTLHEAWNRIEGYWKTDRKRAEQTHTIVEEAHKRGIKVVAYFCDTLSSMRPESRAYMERNQHVNAKGLPVISHYRQPPQRTRRTCASAPDLFPDWLNGIAEAVREFDFDGIYLDSANIPWACMNELHGCGYTDTDGNRHVTYPTNSTRERFRDIYCKIHDEMGKTIQIHPYSSFIPSVDAYCDFIWTGEDIAFEIGRGFRDTVDDATIRTNTVGRNIGVFSQFITYDMPNGKWNFEKSLSIIAPYGVFPIPNDIRHPLDVMCSVWDALDTIDPSNAKFHPCLPHDTVLFADNTIGMTVTPSVTDETAVRVAAYENGDRWLVIVTNPNPTAIGDCKVTLRNGEFVGGILPKSEQYGSEVTLSLEPYSYVFLSAKKESL